MEPFQVLMVGPTRVGKTSTLASMTEALQQEVNKLQYDTTIPDQLIEYLDEFKKKSEENTISVKQLPMEQGTGDRIDYKLDFKSQTKETDITLNFIDVPGGWFIPPTQDHPNAHYDEIKGLIKSSVASMWCIDCVSMIDGKNDPAYGDYHEKRNAPRKIAELYKNLDSIYPKHRLIFVLLRAETYHNSQSKEWLIEKFKECYSPFITEIKQRFNDMEIYVVSVETMGNFKFNCWLVEGKELKATFRRFGNKFAPQNCETPALLAIDRALKEAVSIYEAKKNENLETYKKKYHYPPVRSLIKLGKLITFQWGDLASVTRAAEIYDLLKNGEPISPEKFPKETQENPDINAHIILKRIKSAAETMSDSVKQKKREDNLQML